MKKFIVAIVLSLVSIICANGQNSQARLTISNKSDYAITVKVMKAEGGLYTTRTIGAHSSSTVSFSRTGMFYTKTKAQKGMETLYRQGSSFQMQCDNTGYTEGTLEFYVSGGYGASGQSISKAEFEKDY